MSGVTKTVELFDCYGKDMGLFLLGPDYYECDTLKARIVRVVVAIPAGTIKVLLFPIICLVGLIVMPFLGCGKACHKQESGQFDAYCTTAIFSFIGLAGFSFYILASAYRQTHLNHTVGIYLGAISVSVAAHIFFALQNHAPLVPHNRVHN